MASEFVVEPVVSRRRDSNFRSSAPTGKLFVIAISVLVWTFEVVFLRLLGMTTPRNLSL
jgi:hypothetical protein